MKKISVQLKDGLDMNEFLKAIGFISEQIVSYTLEGQNIILELIDEADEQQIYKDTKELADKYIVSNKASKVIFRNLKSKKYSENLISDSNNDGLSTFFCTEII